ncbi:CD276 antigen homolog [Clarias gariepinus]
MPEREYRTSDFTENLYTHSSRRYQDIMTSFISLYIVLSTVCVNLLSAVPEFSVSGPVGSTAVLPCQLTSVDTDRPYIKWEIKVKTQYKTVFEREGEESYQGEGYEGRVDVPVEELRKGNCSLVLRDLRLTDTELYNSSLAVTNTESGLSVTKEEISRVNLTVHGE